MFSCLKVRQIIRAVIFFVLFLLYQATELLENNRKSRVLKMINLVGEQATVLSNLYAKMNLVYTHTHTHMHMCSVDKMLFK